MEEKAWIYALSLDGESFRYIGKTQSGPGTRWVAHMRAARRGVKQPVYDWIRKHGFENIVVTVIEETTRVNDSEREVFWIAYYRALEYKLLNMTDGGTGGAMLSFSDETRAKLSKAAQTNARNPEWRAKISASLRETLSSPEHQERIKRQRQAMWSDEDFRDRHKQACKDANARSDVHEKKVAALTEQWADPDSPRRRAIQQAMHVRWHTNRNLIKEGCEWCQTSTSQPSE